MQNMGQLSLADSLRASTFAADFSPDIVDSLAASARWKYLAAGSVLFREGQQSDAFYVVHRGHVALEMCLPARGCTALLTLGPGEVVAWSALLGDGRMTASAIASDDVELIEFSGIELLARCEADPVFGYRIMRRMSEALARRLLATRLQLLDLFQADAISPGTGAR
jgi:CRP-like cAMP-binding protein